MVLQGGRAGLASRNPRRFRAASDHATLFDPAEYKELSLLVLLAEMALQPSGFASNPNNDSGFGGANEKWRTLLCAIRSFC
ncbi:hypothetical protein E2K99_03765 [Herbaspirillum huttiense]|uniref:hypothetical protein n=1 Tax=Herbaspirillum huttiense TaxID=863372 RepID=UPI001065A0AE|nr:hypothetical protein [Herbaspirillum huttiense]QBP74187.1 hypothetical protein E2K99_03765 [Herbaspirillum huttiense]